MVSNIVPAALFQPPTDVLVLHREMFQDGIYSVSGSNIDPAAAVESLFVAQRRAGSMTTAGSLTFTGTLNVLLFFVRFFPTEAKQ